MLYYIDPTVPARWRPWFKRGVEVWQPAFAKAGWKDTPRAVLPGDPDWPADFSAGDIRYSTVSFVRQLRHDLGPPRCPLISHSVAAASMKTVKPSIPNRATSPKQTQIFLFFSRNLSALCLPPHRRRVPCSTWRPCLFGS